MKYILFAFMLLASFKSNGQQIGIPYYGDNMLYGRQLPYLSLYKPSDSICKIRGHVWKDISPVLSYFTNGKTDTTRFPVKQDSYIQDAKDTSWRITPLIWNYSCERCKQDSTSLKKEIVWKKQ